jgi:hypothetical protein
MTAKRTLANRIMLAKMAAKTGLEAVKTAATNPIDRAILVEGAKRYIHAIAAGDAAEDGEIERRTKICARCPSSTIDDFERYCGPKFVDLTHESTPTCGCMVIAKAAVGSERCPQGRW